MKASTRRLSLRNFLLSLFLFTFSFALSGLWVSFGQTAPCADAGATVATGDGAYNFQQGDTVYIAMDPRFDQTIRSQVVQGFASWNIANQSNNSGIRYETNGRPSTAPSTASQINVTFGVVYQNGTVAYDIAAQFLPTQR